MLVVTDERHSARNVLVIAVDPETREERAETIQADFDCTVTTVDSNELALEHLAKTPVDVLISAVVSSGAAGLAMIREYRRVSPDTDVIVVTSSPSEFPRLDAIHSGANAVLASGRPLGDQNAIVLRLFHDKDTRARQLAEERRFRKMFEHGIGGNVMLHQPTLQILDVNHVFCELTGLERNEILGKTLYDVLDDDQHERFSAAFSILERTGQGMVGDIALHHVDGQQMCVDISVTFINDLDDPIVHVTLMDVTEQRRVEEDLVSVMQHDALTGLMNKRSLMTCLEAAFTRARNDGIPVSLMFIDLDDFKICNDTHGHQAGDLVLREVGRVIKKSIRPAVGDEGFRYGGDEFAVLLMGTAKEDVHVIADRIRLGLEEIEHHGTTISVGVAELAEGMRAQELIKLADAALYEAKAAGKDTLCVS